MFKIYCSVYLGLIGEQLCGMKTANLVYSVMRLGFKFFRELLMMTFINC